MPCGFHNWANIFHYFLRRMAEERRRGHYRRTPQLLTTSSKKKDSPRTIIRRVRDFMTKALDVN
jgi:hypothetical protein